MNVGRIKIILFFSAILFGASLTTQAETEAPSPSALDQERRLKDDSERQAQMICDSILGKNRSSVLVNVEIGLESTNKGGSALNQKRDSKSGLGDENFILPWVPAPKSVSKEETPKDLSVENQAAQQSTIDVKTILKRFDITVVHDDSIPEERVIIAKEALSSAFDRYKAVLKLVFKASSFLKDNYDPKESIKKNLIGSFDVKTLLYMFLLLLVFMLLRFFFGPLADFMKSYIEGMKEQSKSKVEMDNKSETENESDANNEDDSITEGEDGY